MAMTEEEEGLAVGTCFTPNYDYNNLLGSSTEAWPSGQRVDVAEPTHKERSIPRAELYVGPHTNPAALRSPFLPQSAHLVSRYGNKSIWHIGRSRMEEDLKRL